MAIENMARQLTLLQVEGWAAKAKGYEDFVYNSVTCEARFCNLAPTEDHRLLGVADGVRLWVVGTAGRWEPEVRGHIASVHIPVLKSNIQKSVRRGNTTTAVESTKLALLAKPEEVLRRIPVIAVEDAALIKGYSTIVWLMMSLKYRPLSQVDAEFVCGYVAALTGCREVFAVGRQEKVTRGEITKMESSVARTEVLAVYHRARYGGMMCDTRLLTAAAASYYLKPENIVTVRRLPQVDVSIVDVCVSILPESIDFHPFPRIVNSIVSASGLTKELVKQMIWQAESGVNIRKPRTLDESHIAKRSSSWDIIDEYLSMERRLIRQHYHI